MRLLQNIIFTIAFILICANTVYADDKNDLTITQASRFYTEANAKDADGKIKTSEYGLSAEKEYTLFSRVPIAAAFNIRQIQISNNTLLDLPSTLETKKIYARFYLPAPLIDNDKFFFGLDLFPGFNTASGNGFDSEAFRLNLALSAIYRNENNLIIAAGTIFRHAYEKSVVPFIGFKYKVNDRLDLNFLSLTPNISYKLNQRSKILLELNILAEEFEIIKGNRNGQILSAYGLDAGIGYEHKISEKLSGKISIGESFARKFEYIADGEKGDKIRSKDALYAGYELSIKF